MSTQGETVIGGEPNWEKRWSYNLGLKVIEIALSAGYEIVRSIIDSAVSGP
jgi:hypothetical protein